MKRRRSNRQREHTARRPFFLRSFLGRSSLSTLEKSCGILALRKDSSGNSNWNSGGTCLRNAAPRLNGAERNWFPQVVLGCTTKPIGVVSVPVGLAGCNGVIRFTVVEQDVPPLLPVGILRTLQESLDVDDNGDEVIFRQFGGDEKWTHGHPCRPL